MKKHPGLRVDQTSKQNSCMGNLDGMSPFFGAYCLGWCHGVSHGIFGFIFLGQI